jgi:hypothetical protein
LVWFDKWCLQVWRLRDGALVMAALKLEEELSCCHGGDVIAVGCFGFEV